MSDLSKSFDFSALVPGFDFLKNLAAGSASSAVPGLPGMASWVAPTLSVEEVDKRIQELKAVQFWLDQNTTALKATIQALEVQKMTLSALKGMNVRMEDLASAFTGGIAAASAGLTSAAKAAPFPGFAPAAGVRPHAPVASVDAAAAAAATAEADATAAASARSSGASGAASGKATNHDGAGLVDPLKWWGALTQQFEQIASSALQDAASLKMPKGLQAMVSQTTDALTGRMPIAKTPARASAPRKATAAKPKAVAKSAGAVRTASAGKARPAAQRPPAAPRRTAPPKKS